MKILNIPKSKQILRWMTIEEWFCLSYRNGHKTYLTASAITSKELYMVNNW